MALKPLDKIGEFLNLEELGSGGMGAVYVGYQPAARRLVAIKTLFPEYVSDETHLARFMHEARVYERLDHPSIVHYVDSGRMETMPWIAIEYVRGEDLTHRLEREGRLPVEEALRILEHLADALAHAHEKGIVHRDMKPDNVLLTRDGVVKLIDFGIAQADFEGAFHEPEGKIVGTYTYSSPEQNQGRKTDERSDLYSLGLLLFEMLTGERALSGGSLHEVSGEQMKGDLRLPSSVRADIPKGVDSVVAKLTRKDANARYQKARDLVADLDLLREDPEGFDPSNKFDDEEIREEWEKAKQAFLSRNLEEALQRATVVVESRPDSAEIMSFLGKVRAGLGNVEEAIKAFEKAVELEPETDQHRLDYGIALYNLKLLDEAEEQLNHILSLNPDNPYGKRYMGLIEQARRNPASAGGPGASQGAAGAVAPAAAAPPGAGGAVSEKGGEDARGGGGETTPGDEAASRAAAETVTTPEVREPPPPVSPGSDELPEVRSVRRGTVFWWGLAPLKMGRPLAVLGSTVLQLALVAGAIWPFSSLWSNPVAPSGLLAPLFAKGGALYGHEALADRLLPGMLTGFFGLCLMLGSLLWPARAAAALRIQLLSGRVVEIRRDQSLKVDVGESHGAKVGMLFSIHRSSLQGPHHGDVRVVSTTTSFSICKLESPGEEGRTPAVHDLARPR